MKEINCIAIDDEPIALSIIRQFCARKGGIRLSTFSEPQKGLEQIFQTRPDLVFLDIEMDEIDGLDIAHSLPEGCFFIFTTAYIRYALDGFELDAVDFLHKPFSYERFEKAVDKALRRIEFARKEEAETSIVVKQEYNNITIPASEIFHIEAMENYSKIFKEDKSFILTRMNLKSIHGLLPQKHFLRIHRSYIVAVGKVVSFTKKELKLSNGQILPVGRLYAKTVYEKLQKKMPV